MAKAQKMQISDEVVIDIAGMNKWYGQFHVLRDINMTVNRGERIVICGPSGSGKSTLIRCINRLEEHHQGRLTVDGVELSDDVKAIDAIRKQVGMVFQQFNLFPHLTVLGNAKMQFRLSSTDWKSTRRKSDAKSIMFTTKSNCWLPPRRNSCTLTYLTPSSSGVRTLPS